MSESLLELQDTLPTYIQLLKYGPDRCRFSYGSQKAMDVRKPTDLPPYLILGNLDEDTFRISSSGWSARWQGLEEKTYFEANFIADKNRYEFHQVWRGIDGGHGFCRSEASPEEAVVRCPFLQLPPAWEKALKTELEGKYHLSFVARPDKIVTPFCSPDGFFFAIAFPVSVRNVRSFQSLIQEIEARSALNYPVTVAARRAHQVVNYPEGKAPAWTTDPVSVFKRSLIEIGLVPLEMPVRETANNGSSAWTLRREAYFIFIHIPFAGVCDYLSRISGLAGPIKTVADTPLRFEYWPVVMHSGYEAQVQSLALFDRNRTTRSVFMFALPGQKFYIPLPEDINADPVKTASLLDRAEEISARVTEVVRNPMYGMWTPGDDEPDLPEDRSEVAETQDRYPPNQVALFSRGMPRQKALLSFQSSVNRADTTFSTDHWLLPKVAELATLLSDPISADQAQALDDVIRGRHFMKELTEWLESSHIPWADYFEDLNAQEKRGEALEREQRSAWGEAQRKKWTGAPLGELCLHSVGTMVRGHALAGAGVPESARGFPSFLAWWFAVGKFNTGDSSEWMGISGPWATTGSVELISDEEWAALDATERVSLTRWIDSLGCIFYD